MLCRQVVFDPASDIPSLQGKTILVTGASSGLGKQSVLDLARHEPECIWLTARSVAKAQATARDIKKSYPDAKIKPLLLDLASFRSVAAAAGEILDQSERLDIVILNAGIMAADPALSEDGFEIQMATNHLGHALLTNLLLPLLLKTSKIPNTDVRVVSVSSHGHVEVDKKVGLDLPSAKTTAEHLGAYGRYFQSKLANVLWVRHMAKLYTGLISFIAVHPGVVQTELVNNSSGTSAIVKVLIKLSYRFLATVEDGAKNQLWAATADGVVSGEYYEPVGVPGKASEFGQDDALAKRLWDWTENELGLSSGQRQA